MNAVFVLEPWRRDELLAGAARENAIVALTCFDGSAWVTCKSRCVAVSPTCEWLAIEYPRDLTQAMGQSVFRTGESVGVAFRHGHKKCVFTSAVLAVGSRPGARGRAVTLSWPEQVQELQRRAYYRAKVPPNRPIAVEIWLGGRHRHEQDGVSPTLCVGRLMDVSVGGVCVQVPADQCSALSDGATVGIKFRADVNGPVFMLDAICRHGEPAVDGVVTFGLQLVGVDSRTDDNQTLQQLVHLVMQFQRYEERQLKLTSRLAASGSPFIDKGYPRQ